MNRARLSLAAGCTAVALIISGAGAAAAAPVPVARTDAPGSGELNSHSIGPAVLTAGSAQKPADLTVFTAQPDPYYWVNNFDNTNDYLTWTVTSDRTTAYDITGLLSTSSATAFTLSDDVTGRTITVISHSYGWDRLDMGQLTVPKGVSHLTLKRLRTTSSETDVKSLELVPAAREDGYQASVAGARANSQWLTNAGYGLFFQYGAWGYPPTGPAESADQQACSFNVPQFISMVQSTGAAYVIWSYTWYTYQVDGPNPVIDRILGSNRDTASCDLDLEVAKALQKVGIKFMLYYHNGHDTDPAWWAKQDFPAYYKYTGVGDKSTFLRNWTDVISWTGNHFGSALSGWWFDDGAYYYPANFQKLEQAARAGNPQRLVSWNSWVGPAYTQYQDFQPGETCNGSPVAGSVVGSNGVYLTGPYAGIRGQCLYMLNQDWGVHSPNTIISSTKSTYGVINDLSAAMDNHTALSFNLMMYQDGSVDPATLALLQEVKAVFRDGATPPPPPLNDTSSQITYSGTWGYSANRNAGDFDNDIHYTTTVGASASITFNGTGIKLLAPTDSGYASGTTTLDGVNKGTFSEAAGTSYAPMQTVYSVSGLSEGTHTLVVADAGAGSYFQVDGFQITS
jgi:hypothetical protein